MFRLAPPRARSRTSLRQPDLFEQLERLVGRSRVELGLHALVVEAPAASHPAAGDRRAGDVSVRVEGELPDEGAAQLAFEQ